MTALPDLYQPGGLFPRPAPATAAPDPAPDLFDVFAAPASGTSPRTFTVALPAGLRLLNANQRLHYRRRAEITAALRGAAMEAATENPSLHKALTAANPDPVFQRAHIIGVLHPGDRSRRDPANWYPSFKAGVDGLVDAGVLEDDDNTHVVGPDMRLGHVVKGSRIVLHIRELAPEAVAR